MGDNVLPVPAACAALGYPSAFAVGAALGAVDWTDESEENARRVADTMIALGVTTTKVRVIARRNGRWVQTEPADVFLVLRNLNKLQPGDHIAPVEV